MSGIASRAANYMAEALTKQTGKAITARDVLRIFERTELPNGRKRQIKKAARLLRRHNDVSE